MLLDVLAAKLQEHQSSLTQSNCLMSLSLCCQQPALTAFLQYIGTYGRESHPCPTTKNPHAVLGRIARGIPFPVRKKVDPMSWRHCYSQFSSHSCVLDPTSIRNMHPAGNNTPAEVLRRLQVPGVDRGHMERNPIWTAKKLPGRMSESDRMSPLR